MSNVVKEDELDERIKRIEQIIRLVSQYKDSFQSAQETGQLMMAIEDLFDETEKLRKIRALEYYKKETVYRITEEDIRIALYHEFRDLTDEKKDEIVRNAHSKFTIPNWMDLVEEHIRAELDENEAQNNKEKWWVVCQKRVITYSGLKQE